MKTYLILLLFAINFPIYAVEESKSSFFIKKLPSFLSEEKESVKFSLRDMGELTNPCEKSNNVYGKFINNTIIINSRLVEKAQNNNESFDCRHGNWEKTLRATIIHELAHSLDKKLNYISQKDEYNYLAYGKKRFLRKNISKNTSSKRTPNRYEYKNTSEHFAVNLEYFILDKTYKCRRPNIYNFFVKTFNYTPESDCEMNDEIKVLNNNEVMSVRLNSDEIVEIHYLLAGDGQAIMSRFGHSMFRLVRCPKGKTKDCIKYKSSHIVIGFAAYIADGIINNADGLTGKYPSILQVSTLKSTIEKYNKSELRDLRSIPLKLNKEQKTRFLNAVLNYYWEYSGKYYFLSNNCATEAFQLLKIAFNNKNLYKGSVNFPKKIIKRLKKQNLIDLKKEEKINSHYKRLKLIYKKLELDISLDDYLKLSALLRREIIQNSELTQSKRYRFLAIENYLRLMESNKFTNEIVLSSHKKQNTHLLSIIKDMNDLNFELIYGGQDQGYGIALDNDFSKSNISNSEILEKLNFYYKELENWGKANLSDFHSELNDIQTNFKILTGEIL